MTRKTTHISVDGTSFSLQGKNVSYRFHVDKSSGDLRSDHFGRSITGAIPTDPAPAVDEVWTSTPDRVRREFPDQGRGDFRIPAIRIIQSDSYAVSALRYQSHDLLQGKPSLPGLPATFGSAEDVSTLVVHLFDEYSEVAADLTYSIFPKYDAIVRSASVTNKGKSNISVETLASLSVDFSSEDLEIVGLRGDWAREAQRQRRKVEYGAQSLGSTTGFSSHIHNPFIALVHPSTTESQGEAWGFSLVYSGSFAGHIEKGSQGLVRTTLGWHSDHLSWPLAPGEILTSPECVSIYSSDGIGGMSRSLHSLYRRHLIKSKFATDGRPVLLNSWEALYFNIDQDNMHRLAKESAALGVKLFVMDDGWFGKEYPRTSAAAGLGDWVPNPARFPDGLGPMVSEITSLNVANSSEQLRFGIWIEPEMVNPQSTLYDKHPDWVLHAGKYPRTEQRNQLVLNLALPDVQEFIIKSITDLLNSARITYVKWDQNRAISEISSLSGNHEYILRLYHVFDVLTSRFPDVLWEGCASGGGRFDPGVLQFFPQIWASDNTDPVDRIFIQFGTSLVYPFSSMGAHVSAVPNHQTGRTTPLSFRAHVAMMGGSFGFELDPTDLSEDEKVEIPKLIALADKISPTVLTGDLWRLNLPEDSNWPSALFIAADGAQAVLFIFQLAPRVNYMMPRVKLQGLAPQAEYFVDGRGPFSGSVLMSVGLLYSFQAEYASKVVFLEKRNALEVA